MELFNEILRDALFVLLTAIAGITVKFLVSLINKGVVYINEKIDGIKNEGFKTYCKEMMQAAETMTETLLNGASKKQWVTQKLVEYAQKKNLPITEGEISILIQSIFQELDGITLNTYKQENTIDNAVIEEIINNTVDKVLSETIKKEEA